LQIALVPEGFQSALIAPLVESEIARRWWRDTLVEREATLALVDAQLADIAGSGRGGEEVGEAAAAAAARSEVVAIADVPPHRRRLLVELGAITAIVPPAEGRGGRKGATRGTRIVGGARIGPGPGDGAVEASSVYVVVEYADTVQSSFEEPLAFDASSRRGASPAARERGSAPARLPLSGRPSRAVVVDVPSGHSIGVTLMPLVRKRGGGLLGAGETKSVVVKAVRVGGVSEGAGVRVGSVVKSIQNRDSYAAPRPVATMKDVRAALRALDGAPCRIVFETVARDDGDELWAAPGFNQVRRFFISFCFPHFFVSLYSFVCSLSFFFCLL
jgi:hypothetical protein